MVLPPDPQQAWPFSSLTPEGHQLAAVMGLHGLQRLGDLLRNRQRLIQRDRPFRDPVSEGGAFHQLQHESLGVVRLLDAVDGGNVRVVEAGEDLRLPLEPSEPIGIIRERVGQNLQRDLAVELGVGGLLLLPNEGPTSSASGGLMGTSSAVGLSKGGGNDGAPQWFSPTHRDGLRAPLLGNIRLTGAWVGDRRVAA